MARRKFASISLSSRYLACVRPLVLVLACAGMAGAQAAPLTVTEATDFGNTSPYVNLGKLGLGTNVISGSTERGSIPTGSSIGRDITDWFSVTLDPGLRIDRIEVEVSGGSNRFWRGLRPDGSGFVDGYDPSTADINELAPGVYGFGMTEEGFFYKDCETKDGVERCREGIEYSGLNYTVRYVVDTATAQVPTPGTGALVGLALFALATIQFNRRHTSA